MNKKKKKKKDQRDIRISSCRRRRISCPFFFFNESFALILRSRATLLNRGFVTVTSDFRVSVREREREREVFIVFSLGNFY